MPIKKKPARKSPAKARKTTARKEGVKADGTLKKGYKYAAGGRVEKAAARKAPAKKKAVGLGKVSGRVCIRREANGSTTTYNAYPSASNACPLGGTLFVPAAGGLNGTRKRKK